MRNKGLGGKESHQPGETVFHYDREERLQFLSPQIRERGFLPKSIFKRNRSLLIILLDILLIAMIFLIFSLIGGFQSKENYDGYTLDFKAFEYNGKIFLTLKMTDITDGAGRENNLVEAFFKLGKENARVTEILPEGGARVLRTMFEEASEEKHAAVTITFLGKTYTLRTDITRE